MKKVTIKSIIILLLTFILFWYILKDNFVISMKLLLSSNIIYLFLAILVYCTYFLIEAYLIYKLTNQYSKDYKFFSSIRLNIIVKFFNGITPFSSGGQPVEVYELSKETKSTSKSLLVVVENFVILQISMSIITFIAILLINVLNINITGFEWLLLMIGVVITIGSLVLVIITCLKPKYIIYLVKMTVNFLYRIGIIKDKDKYINSCYEKCDEYKKSFKDLFKNIRFLIECIIINIVYMIIYFLIPYFAFKAINVNIDINIITLIVLSTFTYIGSTFVPLPGASFGCEYMFISLFSLYIVDSYISPALIIWRFITYYLPMIIGGVIYNIGSISKDKKSQIM